VTNCYAKPEKFWCVFFELDDASMTLEIDTLEYPTVIAYVWHENKQAT